MNRNGELFRKLDEARQTLWRELDSISDDAQITAGMTKREVFAHIAGWEALAFAALRQYVYGIPAPNHPYHGVDALNAEFLRQRQNQTVASAKLECEINRFAISTILAIIPDTDFDNMVRFAWGEESLQTFIEGAINHEDEHIDEVTAMKRAA